MKTCKDESCSASPRKRGYCERHYRRARRRGEVGWDGKECAERGCASPSITRGLCGAHYTAVLHREKGACSIEGCERISFAKGWCQGHYNTWRNHGDPEWVRPKSRCLVEGCDHKVVSNGYCDRHYRRVRRYGTPDLPVKPISLGPAPFTCRQCGADLPKLRNGRRTFCSAACKEAWHHWERKRTHRERWLKKYGLTVEEYDALLEQQGGRCAICCSEDPKGRAGSPFFQVDHCHASGIVRGLLCSPCNSALGGFQDNTDVLRAAISYLERRA